MREGGDNGHGAYGIAGHLAAVQCLVSPDDVRNKVFSTVRLREGYDLAEVDTFLGQVEASLARLLRDNEDLTARLAAGDRSARPRAAVQDSAEHIVAEARDEAERIIAEARARAQAIEQEALQKAAALDRDVRERHHAAMRRLKALLDDLDDQPAPAGPAQPVSAPPVPAQHRARHAVPIFDEVLAD